MCVSRNYCFPDLETCTHPLPNHEPLVPYVLSEGETNRIVPPINENKLLDHITEEKGTDLKRKIGDNEERNTPRWSK